MEEVADYDQLDRLPKVEGREVLVLYSGLVYRTERGLWTVIGRGGARGGEVRVPKRLLILALLGASLVPQGRAATFNVSNNNDAGAGSLRQAVINSNAAGGANTLSWSAGSAGTLTLGSNLPSINASTVLDATNACALAPETIAGAFAVPLAGAVTFSNSGANTWTISALIRGSGSLTKTGTGTLALTGANTYTGGTVLKAGLLSVDDDAALGDTSGGVTFQGGTLQTSAGIETSRTITLSGGGTVDTNGSDSLFAGPIDGVGALTKIGAGVLSLSGSNLYSGGTVINAGTLGVSAAAALGSGGISFDGGVLQTQTSFTDTHYITLDAGGGGFDTAGATSTFAGLIIGVGGLTKLSSGTLLLTGANTYSGGTTVKGGILRVGSDVNLGDASGAIALDGGALQTSAAISTARQVDLGASGGVIDTAGYDSTFSGLFTGSGGLTKLGAGTLTLGGGANDYSGGTTVGEGILRYGVDDALPAGGALMVAAGATVDLYAFSQALSLGAVVNHGSILVGANRMTLDNGYSGTGTLSVRLQPGVTNLSGKNLDLSGTALSIGLAEGCLPSDGQTFSPVADSAGGLIGPFTGITSPAALYFVPTYSANSLVLTTRLVPFADVAATPNQAAVGGGLEALRVGPSGDAAAVVRSLYNLDVSQLQSALDQLGPISLASLPGLGLAAARAHDAAVKRRLAFLNEGRGRGVADGTDPEAQESDWESEEGRTSAPHGDSSSGEDASGGYFVNGVGARGRFKGADNGPGTEPGYNYNLGGVLFGADGRLGEHFAVGASAAFLRGHASVGTAAGGTVDENSARLGVYAAARAEDCRASAYVGGAEDFFSTRRGILFGEVSRSAKASPRGTELNMAADASFDMQTQEFGVLSPFVGLNYDHMSVAAFTEHGADSLDLRVEPEPARSLRSSLGMRFSQASRMGSSAYALYLSAGWLHEFSDLNRVLGARLASGSGGAFSVATGSLDRNGALFGGGIVIHWDREFSLNLDYSGDWIAHRTEDIVSAGLNFRF